MADIRLAKPAAGATQTIPCEPSARFVFDFPATDATLAREDDALNISFADGSALRLEGFYQEYNEDNPPSFSVDGTDVTAQDFFTAMNEPDLMPAAGPGASANPTGARFHEWGDADLAGGIDHLNGLDWGFSRSFEWEDLPNAVGLNDDADDGGSQLLASVVPAPQSPEMAPAAPEAPGTVTPEPVEPPAPTVIKNVAYLWDCSNNGSVSQPSGLLDFDIKEYDILYLDDREGQNQGVHYDSYDHLSFVHTAVYINPQYENIEGFGTEIKSGNYPEVNGGQEELTYTFPQGTFAYRDPDNNYKWTLTEDACKELGLKYGEDYIYHSEDGEHHYFLGWDGKLHNIDLLYNGINATRENVENLLNELPDNHQTNILIAGFDVKVESSAIISLTKVDGQTTVSAKIFNYGLDGSWGDSNRYSTIDSSHDVSAALDEIFTGLKSSLIWPVETSWGYNGNIAYQATNYEAAMDFATAWFHSVSSTDQKNINETFLISSGGTNEATRETGGASAYLVEIEEGTWDYYNTSIVKGGAIDQVRLDLMAVDQCRIRENGTWTDWESVSDWKDVNWAPGKEMQVTLKDGHTITIQAVSGFVLLDNKQLKLFPSAGDTHLDPQDYVPVVMGYDEDNNCCTPHTTKIGTLTYDEANSLSHEHACDASKILQEISKVTGIVLGKTIPEGIEAYVSDNHNQLVDEWNGGASDSAAGEGSSTTLASQQSIFLVDGPSTSALAFALNFNSNLESKSGQNILVGDDTLGQYLNSAMDAESVRAEVDSIAEIFDEHAAEVSASADALMGGADDDVLFGLGGNDVLLGDGSAAELRALADHAKASMTDAQGIVAGLGRLSEEDLARVAGEMATLESETDGADRLYGGAGDDVLLGGGGDDYLNGGTGQDILFGGSGNDILVGGANEPVEPEPLPAYNANLAFLVDVNSGDKEEIQAQLTIIMTSLEDYLEKNGGEVNIMLLGFHSSGASVATFNASGNDPSALAETFAGITGAIDSLYGREPLGQTGANHELALNYADAWFREFQGEDFQGFENKTFLLSDQANTGGMTAWNADSVMGGTKFSSSSWIDETAWRDEAARKDPSTGKTCHHTTNFRLHDGNGHEVHTDAQGRIHLDGFDPAQNYVIYASATVYYTDGTTRELDSGAFLTIENGVASYAPGYSANWARPWLDFEYGKWAAGNPVDASLPVVAFQENGEWILGQVAPVDAQEISQTRGYDSLGDISDIQLVHSADGGALLGMTQDITARLPTAENANPGDTLHGGAGNDILFGDLAPEGFQDMDHAGIAKALDEKGDLGDDDKLFGGEGNDILFGGAGNDELHGDAGDDILYGGHGQDQLYGGSGNDILVGGVDDPVAPVELPAYNANLAFLVDVNSGDKAEIQAQLTSIMTSLEDYLEKSGGEVNIMLLGFHSSGASVATFNASGNDPSALAETFAGITGAIDSLYGREPLGQTGANHELALNYADAWFREFQGEAFQGFENKTFLLSDQANTGGMTAWNADSFMGGTKFSYNSWIDETAWRDEAARKDPSTGKTCHHTTNFRLHDGNGHEVRADAQGRIHLDGFDPAQTYVIYASATVYYTDGTTRELDSGAFLTIENGVASYGAEYSANWARPWLDFEYGKWAAGNPVDASLPVVAFQENGEWVLGQVAAVGQQEVSQTQGYDSLGDISDIQLVHPADEGALLGMTQDITARLPAAENANPGDTLLGGDGNDILFGDLAPEGFQGMDHAQIAKELDGMGDAGDDDKLFGGEGNDILFGGAGNDELHGDAGDDILYGGRGQDHLYGGDGNDYLNGGKGNDYLYGDSGDDLIVYDPHDYLIDGGDGIDFLLAEDKNLSLGDLLTKGTGENNMPIVNDVEVLLKGTDVTSLTSLDELAKQYGIAMSNDGKLTLGDGWVMDASQEKTFSPEDGNSVTVHTWTNGKYDGVTLETTLDQVEDHVLQQATNELNTTQG